MTSEPTAPNNHREYAGEQPGRQQFSLKTLMAVVTGMAILFGVLTWLGLNGSGALVAFGSVVGAALLAIACVEFFWGLRKRFWMRRNDRIYRKYPQAVELETRQEPNSGPVP